MRGENEWEEVEAKCPEGEEEWKEGEEVEEMCVGDGCGWSGQGKGAGEAAGANQEAGD